LKPYNEEKCEKMSIAQVGFKPPIPAFELPNAMHSLDYMATSISFTENWTL
jgi:hypothetical protein